jgi:hypothetical protein
MPIAAGFTASFRGALPLAVALLSGCVSSHQAEPDGTTYPRGRVTQVEQRVVGIPFVTIPIRRTEHGDTAEQEVWILPRNESEWPEERLMARIPEVGTRVCRGDHRISETHYFYGTEATLDFLGINQQTSANVQSSGRSTVVSVRTVKSPAVRVLYRCPVTGTQQDEKSRQLAQVSRRFSDHAFFDNGWKNYPLSKENLLAAFRRFVGQKNMPIIAEGRTGANHYIVAGKDPDELRWGRIERVAAIVSGSASQSELLFKHFSYQLTYHKRGVVSTERPGYARGAQPWDRKAAYGRATEFLGEFEGTLKK